jgi:hypothetical protein
VLCNHGLPTDREVPANRPDILIENKKKKACMLIDVAMPAHPPARRQKCHANCSRKGNKPQEFMYRDATNVVHAKCCETCNCKGHIVKDPNITKHRL